MERFGNIIPKDHFSLKPLIHSRPVVCNLGYVIDKYQIN